MSASPGLQKQGFVRRGGGKPMAPARLCHRSSPHEDHEEMNRRRLVFTVIFPTKQNKTKKHYALLRVAFVYRSVQIFKIVH